MHDADFDHEHPSDFELGTDIEGMEMFTLNSVGIDIGSSTSHLVFSCLTLRREGASLSGRFKVSEREVLYRSPIMLTPYLSGTLIDIDKIKAFVAEAYREARLHRTDIDTGAVVITGEALKKENAQPIVEYFAKDSGKFICASAGPHHEALLAAHGCGAVELSKRAHATVLNVDMGGGTTKLSLVQHGAVTRTASINIGARLIAFDERDVVTRVEEAGALLMAQLGHPVAVGAAIGAKQKEQLGALMARILIELITQGSASGLARQLMVTAPLQDYAGLDAVDHIVFSGGVSEHIYNRDTHAYGDLGPILGAHLRHYLQRLPAGKLREPAEGIRATVIGAGEYTVQASGHTSYISNVELLPVFALKVVRVPPVGAGSIAAALSAAFTKFDLEGFGPGLALSLSLEDQIDYAYLRRLAEGIATVAAQAPDCPLYLTLDQDVAKSLGGILKEELKIANDLIAIDGIDVGDLDFIDIGEPMGGTEVIPVTVKSLLFPTVKAT
jgi:ethanolamine utilization protein EutA